jgi:glycosyl hydrolase family 9
MLVSGAMALSAVVTPFSAVNPSFTADAAGGGDNYAKLLQYSLYFYDANMCGDQVNSKTALSWRSNCHTSDEVKGGFHDAGDHVKFGLPAGYSASTLGWSYYEFKNAFNATGQSEHLKNVTDYFAQFFKDSTTLSGDTVTNFVYQIGDGDGDHAEWCAPEVQGASTRKTFSTSSGASDIAASYAASLAVNYVNFGNAEDLKYAKALFDFSTKYNQCATDGPNGFYASWDYYDDQAWAAGWLYLATKDNKYKSFLNEYMNTSGKGKSGQDGCQWGIYSTMSWNNVSMGAGVLQAEITGNSADWKKVTDYLNGHGANSSNYYFENQWGSARYNAAQQLTALVATKHGAASLNDWAKGQMDYIMGNKGVGGASPVCFVVGFADNSAKNPHHRAASGYSNYDEMGDNTQISSKGHSLIGALVGGPVNEGGSYTDSVKDYTANEVTLDYNAAFVGAAAGLYDVYKTGSTVSSIDGVKKIYNSSSIVDPPTSSTTTTTTTNGGGGNVTTTTTSSGKAGEYEFSPKQQIVYDQNADDKMVGWKWSEFNIPATEKVQKVEVKISSNNGNIGKWQGAFGSSTSVAPDYWTQGDDMEESFSGNTGTIVWEVPAETANIIQYNYGGELKFGTWWIDCGNFTIDSVKVYTDGKAPVQSSTTTTTTTTTVTSTTTTTSPNPPVGVKSGDANCDNIIDISDAVLIMQALANPDKYGVYGSDPTHITDQGMKNGDCCNPGDGLTNQDALAIQKFRLKLVQTLPEYM